MLFCSGFLFEADIKETKKAKKKATAMIKLRAMLNILE